MPARTRLSPIIIMKKATFVAVASAAMLALTPLVPYASPQAYGESIETDAPSQEGSDDAQGDSLTNHYTAPGNTDHANVSFLFQEASASIVPADLEYPVTLNLREVDTGDTYQYAMKFEGQILEVERGDYIITSLKDDSRTLYISSADILEIYDSRDYVVRFARDDMGMTFKNFLADNILLAVILVLFAAFYQFFIVKRFSGDIRR